MGRRESPIIDRERLAIPRGGRKVSAQPFTWYEAHHPGSDRLGVEAEP